MPGVGQGGSWFEIDVLGFDQEFLSLLGLIASFLTILGIFVLRPLMEKSSMTRLIVILSIAGSFFILPSIAMFYGFHEYTSKFSNGFVDARFIAIFNIINNFHFRGQNKLLIPTKPKLLYHKRVLLVKQFCSV